MPISTMSASRLAVHRWFPGLADHPRLRAVVRKFALQMPERMQAIEQAWSVRDFESLASLAHWLKGSGGTTGFDAFTAPAKTLEELAKAKNEQQTAEIVAELRQLVEQHRSPNRRRGRRRRLTAVHTSTMSIAENIVLMDAPCAAKTPARQAPAPRVAAIDADTVRRTLGARSRRDSRAASSAGTLPIARQAIRRGLRVAERARDAMKRPRS